MKNKLWTLILAPCRLIKGQFSLVCSPQWSTESLRILKTVSFRYVARGKAWQFTKDHQNVFHFLSCPDARGHCDIMEWNGMLQISLFISNKVSYHTALWRLYHAAGAAWLLLLLHVQLNQKTSKYFQSEM